MSNTVSKKYTANTALSSMRASILSTLEHFNQWASNEFRCLSPQSLGQLHKTWDGNSFLAINPRRLLHITVCYPNIFLSVSTLERLVNTNQGFTYMHEFIHIYIHTHTYIYTHTHVHTHTYIYIYIYRQSLVYM